MPDTIRDSLAGSLADLEKRLPAAEERASKAKAEWDRALTEVAALHQTIDALTAYLKAQGNSGPTIPGTGKHSRAARRSRSDLITVMREDGMGDRVWTIPELAAAFDHRRWSLHMEQPESAIKNMASRLVADGLLERVRPGAYRLKPRPQLWSTDHGIVDENDAPAEGWGVT